MIERYEDPAVKGIFSRADTYELWRRVEITYIRARYDCGEPGLTRDIREAVQKSPVPAFGRIELFEQQRGHDVVAFLEAWTEEMQPDVASKIHMGLTSSDLVDNALFYQLELVRQRVERGLIEVMNRLLDLGDEYANVHRIGRTHGQWAEPTTFGWRFKVWARTASILVDQSNCVKNWVNVFKSPGAVGNMRLLGDRVAGTAALMWGADLVHSTQVIPRQRLVGWAAWLVQIVSLMEEIALEVRLSSRTEVGEMMEGGARDRAGSSAMPHKRNPISSEQVSGLARVARSHFAAIAETAGNLHNERDISNSSVERLVVPDLSHLTCHIMYQMLDVLNDLDVNEAGAGKALLHAWDSARVQFNLQRLGLPYVQAQAEALDWVRGSGWEYDRVVALLNEVRPADAQLTTSLFLKEMAML